MIENAEKLPEKTIGRPLFYPFDQLNAGQKLTIEPKNNEDLKELRKKIASSLFHYKRNNGFTWLSVTRTEAGNIVIYRLN